LLASAELLQHDYRRWKRDVTRVARFFALDPEENGGRVKNSDLFARPSRQLRLIDQLGDHACYGPEDICGWSHDHLTKVQERILARLATVKNEATESLYSTVQVALRKLDRRNCAAKTIRSADDMEAEGSEYQPSAEETDVRRAAPAASNVVHAEVAIRLRIQDALLDPAACTPELVVKGIAWARRSEDRWAEASRKAAQIEAVTAEHLWHRDRAGCGGRSSSAERAGPTPQPPP
jgi:hypothetical protein